MFSQLNTVELIAALRRIGSEKREKKEKRNLIFHEYLFVFQSK